jgi:protein gp37
MADGTKIEWTDATWNPITGCSVVSPGCTNCYAMKLAGTRLKHSPSRQGLTTDSKTGPVWNGQVRLNEQWLDQPLLWRDPRMIFVCAHGDLFHEAVPDEWIDRVFAVMASATRHTFQVLTKRAGRMRGYLSNPDVASRIQELCYDMPDRGRTTEWHEGMPLPNVWLGVSVEDQARADERIPLLLETPAAKRFASCEPLLGLVTLRDWLTRDWHPTMPPETTSRIDWVIAGGESGPGARPMHPDWARSLRDQCQSAGVPFFMKQMWGTSKSRMPPIPDDLMIREFPA